MGAERFAQYFVVFFPIYYIISTYYILMSREEKENEIIWTTKKVHITHNSHSLLTTTKLDDKLNAIYTTTNSDSLYGHRTISQCFNKKKIIKKSSYTLLTAHSILNEKENDEKKHNRVAFAFTNAYGVWLCLCICFEIVVRVWTVCLSTLCVSFKKVFFFFSLNFYLFIKCTVYRLLFYTRIWNI